MKEIIAPTLGAVTDKTIHIPSDGYFSFAQSGLAGVEVISFEINLDGTWTPVTPAIQLTATSNFIQVAGPATYRINKPITAGLTSVYLEE